MCSKCGNVNPYEGIKNNTKGGYDDIAYRMKRYAARYDIQFNFPFDYLDFIFDSRIGKQSFRKHLTVLQGFENMLFQSIMSKTTYSTKILSSVLRGKHPPLQTQTLWELKNWFYDWNTGQRIIVDNPRQIIKM